MPLTISLAMSKTELLDKAPPADKAIEAALLGCVLVKPGIFPTVQELLSAAAFVDPAHQRLFAVFAACKAAHEPTEARFVLPRLRKLDEHAAAFIAELVKSQPVVSNWKHYANRLKDLASKRQVLEAAIQAIQAVHADKPTDALVREIAKHGTQQRSQVTTLRAAGDKFAEGLEESQRATVGFGIPELDDALDGGAEPGEFVILAARPSHGKSAVALQAVHNWTALGLTAVFVSEEMSAAALGKRTLQFASDIGVHNWRDRLVEVRGQLADHFDGRAECYIVEHCHSADVAAEHIRTAVKESGAKVAVIDYAQLLTSPGAKRYEQITNTSITLRQVANETGVILLALCQLNREIEKRTRFEPKLSDLRETGQLEQDADVIVFGVWPHRIDPRRPPNEYKFYIAKNRNRAISKPVVQCRFEPMRQRFVAIEEKSDEPF